MKLIKLGIHHFFLLREDGFPLKGNKTASVYLTPFIFLELKAFIMHKTVDVIIQNNLLPVMTNNYWVSFTGLITEQ